MELLLTPGEIEQRAKDITIGEKKVAVTSKRMDTWQQKQKTGLQGQYDVAVKKVQLAILKKKNQVELSKYRLKSKESLADFDAYQAKLLATKISKLDAKRDQAKLKHDLKVGKLQAQNSQVHSANLINSLDKKLAKTNQKHDVKVAEITASHQKTAAQARDNFLAKTPLTETKLKALQLTNNAIINDLKDYEVDQVGKYEHQIDLLTQNLNQGMLDIDDGVKAGIEQAKKTNIDKIEKKYAKKNFKANYQKGTTKLKAENQWNYASAHKLLVNLYNDSDKSYTPTSILATEFYQGQKTKAQNW